MIAVQRPVNFFSPPSTFSSKPQHSRNPSAPVVVRPTHTPGLLSLSKPAQQPSSRPQQSQQYARAPRSSARGKANQRSQQSPQSAPAQARPVEDAKKSSQPKARTDMPSAPKAAKSVTSASTPERAVRGRQPNKPAPKDKAERRSPSPPVTSSRTHARRIAHQPSPTRILQQADMPSHMPVNPFRAQSFEHRDSDCNLFDPFVTSSSDNESDSTTSPSKAGNKSAPIPAPALASRPSGKLARRRQAGHANGSPATSKAVPVPRSKGSSGFSHAQLAHSEPALNLMQTPKRPGAPRFVSGLPLAEWDEFPVSDETLLSPPSTPVRPSASVPRRFGSGVTWQQTMLDDAPRTAPLSSTFNFPFAPAAPCVTPSPAHRRRHHQRVPSEGVFAMSTDEESSTDSSDELKKTMYAIPPFDRRAYGGRRTPSPPVYESPAGFYAGSIYQNSPSPDDLPVPAFRA